MADGLEHFHTPRTEVEQPNYPVREGEVFFWSSKVVQTFLEFAQEGMGKFLQLQIWFDLDHVVWFEHIIRGRLHKGQLLFVVNRGGHKFP